MSTPMRCVSASNGRVPPATGSGGRSAPRRARGSALRRARGSAPRRARGSALRRARDSALRRARDFALAACALGLFGCGQVSFGDDLVALDAGVPELGPEPDLGVDAGPRDVPPVDLGDAGCIPVPLPTEPPEDWPFAQTSGGYREVFWSWAVPELGCSGTGSCHGSGESPFIPVESEVDARYEEGIAALWPLVRSAPRLDADSPSGALWRHMPNHPDHVAPSYFGAVPARLDALVQQARDCNVDRVLKNPPDAGIDCSGGASPDAGPNEDAGSPPDSGDAGMIDGSSEDAAPSASDAGGAGSAGLCYCPLPDVGPLMTSLCAP